MGLLGSSPARLPGPLPAVPVRQLLALVERQVASSLTGLVGWG